jgi:hypothetical protein
MSLAIFLSPEIFEVTVIIVGFDLPTRFAFPSLGYAILAFGILLDIFHVAFGYSGGIF